MEKQEEKDAIFATSELVLNIKSRMQQMNPAQRKSGRWPEEARSVKRPFPDL